MRKYTLGFLVALTALPVMAATGVSRLIPGAENTESATTASRALPSVASSDTAVVRKSGAGDNQTTSRVATTRSAPTRVISSKKTSVRTTSSDASRGVAVARSQNTDTARSNLSSAVNTVGRSSRTSAASINNNPAVRRLGLTLRPSTAEVGGRAVIGNTGKQTGSNIENDIRNVSSRAAVKLDAAAISAAKEQLEQTSELNKSCQEMYNECMDQFCAVVDTNQKRCSCSANLAKYNKVEAAVKDANIQLNEVAQNIRYIGLTPDEVRAIMTETEAEEALSGTKDTSESRSMLSKIEKMIQDPSTTGTSDSSDGLGLLDIDLDFSSDDISDMFSLGSLFGDGNRGISSMRGKELYNAAKKRCDTVLKQCKDAGATTQQVTGNYDLAIDKDCAAYEAGLNKMNETLLSNVRSANRMLQKARLTVMQDQNAYDARGCVNALESCMTDDVVCGSDYAKCLDPTKTFIDENGAVVLGGNIGKIREFMVNYNNAAITKASMAESYKIAVSADVCARDGHNDGSCIVKYLIDKIGTKQKAIDEGLCRPVLDKCRAYTYDTNGTYIPYNDVVVNYVQRAMVNIKGAQSKIIADYASTCLTDISNCYNNQVSQLNTWTTAASATNIRNVMRGACRNVALTCAYAVFDGDTESCSESNKDECIESISEVFYQSLLCPDNSIYDISGNSPHDISPNGTRSITGSPAWVNGVCRCNVGYMVQSGVCTLWCPANSTLDSTATQPDNDCARMGAPVVGCRCNSGYVSYNGGCAKPNTLTTSMCSTIHNSITLPVAGGNDNATQGQ